jgi:WD40 repeat protein
MSTPMLRLRRVQTLAWLLVAVPIFALLAAALPSNAQPAANATPARLVWQSESPPFAHRGATGPAAFSPDGRSIVTFAGRARNINTFFVWDAATGQLLRRLEPEEKSAGSTYVACYSPDGKYILGTWGTGFASVWEAATGRELFTRKIHGETILSAEFLPDSAHIATGGSDGKVTVTRIADQANVATWSHAELNASAAGSPFGGSGGAIPTTASLDVASDGRILTAHWRATTSVAFVWQVGAAEPAVGIARANQGTTASGRVLESAVFTEDGAHIISAGSRIVPRSETQVTHGPLNVQVLELRKWDAKSGQLLAEYSDPNVHGFGHVEISPDGRTLATLDFGAIHLWRLGENKPFRRIETPGSRTLGGGRFSPDSQRIALGVGNTIQIYDVESGQLLTGGDPSLTPITSVAWNATGSQIALGSANKVEVWDLPGRRRQFSATMGELRGLFSRARNVGGVGFSTDGAHVIAGGTRDDDDSGEAGVIRTWNIGTGALVEEVKPSPESNWVASLLLSFDRRRAIVVFESGAPALYDLANRKSLAIMPAVPYDRHFKAAQFAPDGRRVYVVNYEGEAFRWNPENGDQEAIYTTEWRAVDERGQPPRLPWVEHAAFSPDGRFLVISHRANSQGLPQALAFWDNELRLPIRILRDVPVCRLVISPDSRRLAGIETDTSVPGQLPTDAIHIWDLSTGQELFTLHPQDARATAMAFSPDSKQLLTGFDRGTFAIWDVR